MYHPDLIRPKQSASCGKQVHASVGELHNMLTAAAESCAAEADASKHVAS